MINKNSFVRNMQESGLNVPDVKPNNNQKTCFSFKILKSIFSNNMATCLFFNIVLAKSMEESFYYEFIYTMDEKYDWNFKKTGYVIMCFLIIVLPILLCLVIFFVEKIKEKTLVCIALIFCQIGAQLKINYKGTEKMDFYYYIATSAVFFLFNQISEVIIFLSLAEVISPVYSSSQLYTGISYVTADTSGRVLGSSLLSQLSYIDIEIITTTLYSIYAQLFIILSLICWRFRKNFEKLILVQQTVFSLHKSLKLRKEQYLLEEELKFVNEYAKTCLDRHASKVYEAKMDKQNLKSPDVSTKKIVGEEYYIPFGRKVSDNVIRNSKLCNPAIRKKLGSSQKKVNLNNKKTIRKFVIFEEIREDIEGEKSKLSESKFFSQGYIEVNLKTNAESKSNSRYEISNE